MRYKIQLSYSLQQFSLWGSYGLLFSYANRYLLAQGMSNTEAGLLLGIVTAIAFVLQPLLTSLALPLAAGGLSAALAGDIRAVYDSLLQPPLSPPGPVFPVVWTTLYLMMGVALYLVRDSDSRKSPPPSNSSAPSWP